MADDISTWVHDEHIRLHHRYQSALAAYEKGSAGAGLLVQRPASASETPREDQTLKRAVNDARDRLRAFEVEHGLNVRN